jgi:hypothetical protein
MPFVETSDHTQLSFTDWGSGPPILFTHAWGLSSDQWAYQTPSLLGQGFRCLAYDRRGHGRSDRPGTGYDFETLADDLATIIELGWLSGNSSLPDSTRAVTHFPPHPRRSNDARAVPERSESRGI